MKIFATLRIEKDKRIIHVANLNSTMVILGRDVTKAPQLLEKIADTTS